MADLITAGNILVQEGTNLPRSLLLHGESCSNGWALPQDVRASFEKVIREAGWTFFFMAGEIRTTVFGFDRQKSLRAALNRLIKGVKSQRCNNIEITRVEGHSLFGLPYVSVSAHPRHLQKGLVFQANTNSI